ncbi:MAG: YvcK family protein [Actinomycetota bacterium]|nr:YvcK family protein [Actinomycetota bacterium]
MTGDGPAVVAIGGGHGLATSLAAIRRYAGRITAVVSVADDGGSSGRLRELLGIPAPGDLRKCLGALLPSPSPLGRALEHRFAGGGELDGHAFGNLLIAALAATRGDFVAGVEEACRLLGTVGSVLPATNGPVVLKAEAAGSELEGQVRIMGTPGVTHVSLVPPDAAAPQEVLDAIEHADQVVLGPGSLYTSVLAACAPVEVNEAIASSAAACVYVCNLREQVPETAGYDVAAHVAALEAHWIEPDWVLADTSGMALGDVPPGSRVVTAALAAPGGLVHDAALLEAALRRAVL